MTGLISSGCSKLVESQLFYPDRVLIASPDRVGLAYEDVWFETEDGVRLHGWYLPAEGARHLVLFSHGNAGNISHRLDNLARLHALGLSLFIYDYRGYGRSEGSISIEGFYRDAEAALAQAVRIAGEERLKLVIFGRSLGGAAAVRQAARGEPAGVILESTFTNLGAMAAAHYPLPGLRKALAGRLNSLGEIDKVSAPLLFFHGDRDEVVPYELGRELYRAAPAPKEFVTIPGAGHNDTYFVAGQGYFVKFKSFIDALGEAR